MGGMKNKVNMVVLGWNDCIFKPGGQSLLKPNFSENEEETKRPIGSIEGGVDSMGLKVIRILDRKTYSGERSRRRTRKRSGSE
jgi:hypothetical protein